MLTLIVVSLTIILLYYYFTRNHSYWAKRGVKHEKPVALFGTYFKPFFGYYRLLDTVNELYYKHENEKFFGYYMGNVPELYVKDPDLIRNVLSVDFSSFYVRGLGRDPKKEPLLYSLFHIEGDDWKLLRQRLTPAFTTSKLKNMFPLIIECAKRFEKLVQEQTNKEECDVKELMSRFTTDFIGVCGFGVEMDCINNEKSPFREFGRLIVLPTFKTNVIQKILDLLPELNGILAANNEALDKFLENMFLSIKKQRNYKPIGRNDFIDMLLELEAQGTIEGFSIESKNSDGSQKKISLELHLQLIVAQVFVFFAAGFETSSSSTSFLLHQLALNPDIQRKVQEDIDSTLARYNNQLCYDAIAEMQYLGMAFKESLRMLPPVAILNRVCAKKYTFPGTDLTIDPGVRIAIPIHNIHNDEKYFDNPSEFRPERFLPEEEQKRHKFVYMPFGEGSRSCIGERLGRMQSLAGLAEVIHKFNFEPSKSTRRELRFDPWSNIGNTVIEGLHLKITKRKVNFN